MMATNQSLRAYKEFVVPVDDLDWTSHWLGRRRCDLLLISVATSEDLAPAIKIRAVESKARADIEEIDPHPSTSPFDESVEQLTSTLDAMWDIMFADGSDSLIEDLRFSSFMEHLISVALAEMDKIDATDTGAHCVVKTLSRLSSRSIKPSDVALDGVAVCLQYRAAVKMKAVTVTAQGYAREWPITLVRAGTDELENLLGSEIKTVVAKTLGTDATPSLTTTDIKSGRAIDQDIPDNVSSSEADLSVQKIGSDSQRSTAVTSSNEPTVIPDITTQETVNHDAAHALARDLFFACSQRGFQVEEPRQDHLVIGPSLIAVSMALRAGASIRPIQAVCGDLAREVGVHSITVENDSQRPFHIRFLVARKDRVFPLLPEGSAPVVDQDSESYLGLYLGQTLDGQDFISYVSSWPHMLIGGTTGSGKTTFIRSILAQIGRFRPDLVKVVVIDGKREVDYLHLLDTAYFAEPFGDVILGHDEIPEVLDWVVKEEMERRRSAIHKYAANNPAQRPKQARSLFVEGVRANTGYPFAPLIVVIDEFAEIMVSDEASNFERRVQQITQVGRSSLVHLVLATQRPDSKVISGAIKANLDARVALRLPTHHDSMTVLGGKGAEQLLGLGDLVFQSAAELPVRLQGYSLD